MWQLHLEAFSVKPHVVKGACNWKKRTILRLYKQSEYIREIVGTLGGGQINSLGHSERKEWVHQHKMAWMSAENNRRILSMAKSPFTIQLRRLVFLFQFNHKTKTLWEKTQKWWVKYWSVSKIKRPDWILPNQLKLRSAETKISLYQNKVGKNCEDHPEHTTSCVKHSKGSVMQRHCSHWQKTEAAGFILKWTVLLLQLRFT